MLAYAGLRAYLLCLAAILLSTSPLTVHGKPRAASPHANLTGEVLLERAALQGGTFDRT